MSRSTEGEARRGRPAVFLDRDGTINVEKEYLFRIEDLEWLPGTPEAIRKFNQMGYAVIVISNQSGIARGMFTEGDVEKLHEHMQDVLSQKGAVTDGWYYCPHHPEFGDKKVCECRKPRPGLIHRAQEEYDIDLSRSYVIGDRIRDLEMCISAGVTPILVRTGYGKDEERKLPANVLVLDDLATAAQWIENHSKSGER